MNLRTIWTLPLMRFSVRIMHTRNALARMIAVRLPHRIRYWSTIAMIADSLDRCGGNTETPLMRIMSNLDQPKNLY